VVGGLNPETLATYPRRLSINRNSPYSLPKWAEGLIDGLPSFDTRQCTTGITARIDPNAYESEAFKERAIATEGKDAVGNPDPSKNKSQEENAKALFERIQEYAFGTKASTSEISAPPCIQQRPFEPIYGSGPSTQYQHTFEQPQP
jgi:hypothetical protein